MMPKSNKIKADNTQHHRINLSRSSMSQFKKLERIKKLITIMVKAVYLKITLDLFLNTKRMMNIKAFP